MSTAEAQAHVLRAALAAERVRGAHGAPLALDKDTTNLFRDRRRVPRERLDLREFHHVLGGSHGCVDVEGCATYEELVDWCLARGCMPAVVPQLKTITVGGAVAGLGIEATSFREGLVHHTVRELEVLVPSGEVVHCTPSNAHRDLFHGFPNSHGTLGYALRVRLGTVPVLPYVHVRHVRFDRARDFFAALEHACGSDADFVDGVAFGGGTCVLDIARFSARAPWRSDYTRQRIWWKSLLRRPEDYLSVRDWLWRWDTDWFWCSRNFGAENPWVRRVLGRERLNSRTWTHWMRLASRWRVAERFARLRGLTRESVIQDVDIPIGEAARFLEFLDREIGIHPVWICPVRGDRPAERFPLYPLCRAGLYVNFGFWDAVLTRERHEAGHFNRLVEDEVRALGGIKSLYSDSYFTPGDFASAYGQPAYADLKARYDPQGRAPGLYEKCVLHG